MYASALARCRRGSPVLRSQSHPCSGFTDGISGETFYTASRLSLSLPPPSLARRLERFVGGQLINKSWREGWKGEREREREQAGEQTRIRERRGRRAVVQGGKRGVDERGEYKRMEYYAIYVSYRPVRTLLAIQTRLTRRERGTCRHFSRCTGPCW